jgi:hypothetical protein
LTQGLTKIWLADPIAGNDDLSQRIEIKEEIMSSTAEVDTAATC